MTQGRKACRAGESCTPRTFDEALYCLVNHSEKDAGELAEAIRHRRGYLIDCANPDRDNHLHASDLPTLTTRSGNTVAIEYLARACGGVFVPLPTAGVLDPRSAALSVMRHLGEATQELELALADGLIEPDEAERIHRSLQGLLDAVVSKKAAVIAATERQS